MVTIPLGVQAYKRKYAGEPEVRLQNRFLEVNPTNPREHSALLTRCGSDPLTDFPSDTDADAPNRAQWSKVGLFNGDLFGVSGGNLWRYATDGTKIHISGLVNGSGFVTYAWMKGIGYEYLFISDGLLLQFYSGGTHAKGKLSATSYDYSWVARTVSEDNAWQDVCWSPDLTLFCAVSNYAVGHHSVMTSPDGITWTLRTAPDTHSYHSVCWSPELTLFVAVGGEGAIMTSPDGTTWTARTPTQTVNPLLKVVWSPDLSLLVAVGKAGTVATSGDGITWTAQTAAVDNDWYGLCWSPDKSIFCATAATGIGNRVMTSPDGFNWVTQNSPADSEWEGVCWSPDLELFCMTAAAATATSPDGETWTLGPTLAPSPDGHDICWSSELGIFVVMGGLGVFTSTDGLVWTARTPANADFYTAVCWAPDIHKFVAVGSSGAAHHVQTSTGTVADIDTSQILDVDGVYYGWNSDVDNNAPDGSSAHPWLAKLGDTTADSITAMANLFNFNGTRGDDFSTALGGPNTLVTATNDNTSMTLTAIVDTTAGNAITTSIFAGTGLAWDNTTLTGGGTHALEGVEVPDGKPTSGLASQAGFVLVSISDSQEFFWLEPGSTTIDSLNFAEKESAPDNIVDVISIGDEVLFIGAGSTEGWYATGDLNAPFAPIQGRAWRRGMVEGTAVAIKDTLVFVGDDGIVYSIGTGQSDTSGYGVNRISTHGIEERIRVELRREQGLTP